MSSKSCGRKTSILGNSEGSYRLMRGNDLSNIEL